MTMDELAEKVNNEVVRAIHRLCDPTEFDERMSEYKPAVAEATDAILALFDQALLVEPSEEAALASLREAARVFAEETGDPYVDPVEEYSKPEYGEDGEGLRAEIQWELRCLRAAYAIDARPVKAKALEWVRELGFLRSDPSDGIRYTVRKDMSADAGGCNGLPSEGFNSPQGWLPPPDPATGFAPVVTEDLVYELARQLWSWNTGGAPEYWDNGSDDSAADYDVERFMMMARDTLTAALPHAKHKRLVITMPEIGND